MKINITLTLEKALEVASNSLYISVNKARTEQLKMLYGAAEIEDLKQLARDIWLVSDIAYIGTDENTGEDVLRQSATQDEVLKALASAAVDEYYSK